MAEGATRAFGYDVRPTKARLCVRKSRAALSPADIFGFSQVDEATLTGGEIVRADPTVAYPVKGPQAGVRSP